MPSINSFRIVNFDYDNGKKKIADEIYELEGNNTLIALENGGGKSVIIHLLLNIIMPGIDMGNRKIADYFKGNTTSHLLIEWSLDGEGKDEKILTGMCIKASDRGIKYFNYTNIYNERGPNDIKSIPIIDKAEKRVKTYSRWLKEIKELKGSSRIQYFPDYENKSKYRNFLKDYKIYHSEFHAIKTINETEGGIDKFFVKAKKSKDIIESIIIPSISDINYEKTNKNSLKESFKNHIQQLKDIPDLEKSIHRYEIFLEKGKIISLKLQEYKDYTERKLALEDRILSYKIFLKAQIKEIEIQISNLQIEIDKITVEINDLNYKEKSLVAYEMKKEIYKHEKVLNKLQGEYSRNKEELKRLDYRLRFLKSSIAFKDMKTYEVKIADLEQRLKKLTESKRNQEYISCLLEYKELLKKDIRKSEAEKIKCEKIYEEKEKENKKIIQKLEIIDEDINKEEKNININMGKKNLIDEEMSYIEKELEENLLYFSEINKNLEKEKFELSKIESLIKEKHFKVEKLEKSIENTKDELKNLEKVKNKKEEIKKSEENEKDLYVQIDHQIKEDLKQIIGVEIKLFQDSMNILLTEKEKEKNLDIIDLEIEIRDLKSKDNLYEKSNYYLPYKEILETKGVLEEQSISCITGVEYIKRQPKPKKLMDKYPLLIYSLIITKKDLVKLNNIYENLKSIEKPMLFYTGDSMDLEEIKKESDLDNIKGENKNLHIMKSENLNLVLDDKKFKEYKESIVYKINQKEEKLSRDEKYYKKIQKIIHSYEEFTNRYDKDYLENISKNILLIEESIQLINTKIKNKNQFILKSINNIKDTEIEIEELKNKRENQGRRIEKIGKYIEKKEALHKIRLDIREHKKSKEEFEIYKEKETEKSTSIKERIKEISNKLNNILTSLEKEKKKLQETNIKLNNYKTIDFQPVKIEYELKTQLIGKIDALEAKIQDFNIEDMQNHLQECYGQKVRLKESIVENGFNLEKIEFDEKIQRSDVNQINLKISSKNDSIDKISELISKKKEKIDKSKGRLEVIKSNIIKEYGKAEYEFKEDDEKNANYYKEKSQDLTDKKTLKINDRDNKKKETEKLNNYYTNRLLSFIKDNMIDLIIDENKILEHVDKETIEKDINSYNSTIINLKEIFDVIREKTYKLKSDNTSSGVIKTLDKIMELLKPDIESCKNVEEIFSLNVKKIENTVKAKKEQLKEVDKSKKSIVINCVQRSKTLYEQLNDVDKYSKIKINDKYQKLIKFIFPKVSDEEWEDRIDTHISLWINEMKANESMQDPIKIDKEIEDFVRPESLLDSAINLDEFIIKISKPRSNENDLDYYQWEEVVNWSGGEKLSAFFAMFISIISYLRRKRSVETQNKKVIIIDNPFGQANAEFLLNYIFKLSEKNDTQMICFTGITEESIFKQFPLIISLVHREITKDRSYLVENNRIENRNLESARFEIKSHQESLF